MAITRFVLIVSILLAAYSLVMLVILIPWAWAILPIVVITVLYRKRGSWHAMGTARWANLADLCGNGMVEGGNGLMIGQVEVNTGLLTATKALFDSSVPSDIAYLQFLGSPRKPPLKTVRLNNAIHTAVFAPTGVGKGVSLVVPHLLTCRDSMVVVDFKGENAKITANARRKMGHRIVLLDPFMVVTQTPDTFNALDFIKSDSPLALDDSRDIGNALVLRTGGEKEPHWNDSAETWISTLTSCVVRYGEGDNRSLQTVRTLLCDPEKLKKAIELMCGSDAWEGMLSRMGFALTRYVDRELGSVLTTSNRHLRFLDTIAIANSTKSSSFDPHDLVRGKMTIYLVLPPEHMRAQSPLLRLWIGSMLRAVVRGGLQEKNKVHFVCDEAASIGHLDAIDDAVDKYRGYGVRLQFYFQSLGQLSKCFPDGQEQTLLSNVTQVFFGVNDQQTAEYVSARLGEETIIVESGGTGTSTTNQRSEQGQWTGSYSNSTNDNWAQQARKLLKPEEVVGLSERIAITLTPGVPPIWTKLVRYYEPGFRSLSARFRPAVRSLAAALCLLMVTGSVGALLTWVVCGKPLPLGNDQNSGPVEKLPILMGPLPEK